MTPVGLVAAPGADTDLRILVGFEESEGYVDGSGLEGMDGWWISEEGSGVITGEEYEVGAQSLRIAADEVPVGVEYRAENVFQQGVRFIEASIKPLPVEGEDATVFLNFWGAEMEFSRGNDHAIYLHLGHEMEGNASGNLSFPVSGDAEEQTGPWLQMVIRQDMETAKWDLFLNGELVAVDLALGELRESMEIEAKREGEEDHYPNREAHHYQIIRL